MSALCFRLRMLSKSRGIWRWYLLWIYFPSETSYL